MGYIEMPHDSSDDKPSEPRKPAEDQYEWASSLPYTVEFRGDRWCTWTVIGIGLCVVYGVVDALGGSLVTFDNMLFIMLLMAVVAALVAVCGGLATYQLYQYRKAACEAGFEPRDIAPRGWVMSIVLLVLGIGSTLLWISPLLAAMS
ncbi:hypothetical protein [Bifidobacterium leontopitheci]|uniref:Uncharacterized protein n=1 Tax=Bifidobacterium leontopitheci TaxID=2650774 RepID=A0A6I1GI24_9BIFI|nr:hypothetical protein [Bifidobacterium leontopitheci]KAB7789049.1 hypothetical protein F7D09_2000 [Bifidobacterium leontopitheci]